MPRTDADAPVFLVGFMGAGKSTAGQALAGRWGWAFVDVDALVEQAAGRTIEEIFQAFGEGRFREMEWEALLATDGRSRVVVATGGGLFLGVAQRAFMKARGITVWLDAPLPIVEQRLSVHTARPLWGAGDALARRAFFEKRRAAYALADLRVDAGASDPEAVAGAIESARGALLTLIYR